MDEARAYAVLMDELGLGLGEVAEHVGRSKPTVSNRVRLLELPDDVLGLVERGQRSPRATPGQCWRSRTTRSGAAWPAGSCGEHVRARRGAGRAGRAHGRSRRRQPVDPALAERARDAVRRLTGAEAKVAAGRVELYFADEVELEEMVEASSAPRYNRPARAISSVG